MADLVVKRHDTWPPVKAQLKQKKESNPAEEEPIDLSTALKVKFIMKGAKTVVEGTAAIGAGAAGKEGKVEYTWAPGDTANAETYKVEWEIEWSSTHFETVPNENYDEVQIQEDLGGH